MRSPMSSAVLAPAKTNTEGNEPWELEDNEQEAWSSPLEVLLPAGDDRDEERRRDQKNRFELLATELAHATGGMSSTPRAMSHPAYQEIPALGRAARPLP